MKLGNRSAVRHRVRLSALLCFVSLLILVTAACSSVVPSPTNTAQHRAIPANIDFASGGYGAYDPAALSNPTIGGVDINIAWSEVEPQQGTLSFAPLDAEMRDWAQAGKQFILIVRYANEDTSNRAGGCPLRDQYLPTWEMTRIPHFCDSDPGTIIPDYFNATFQADLLSFVQALATHVDSSGYRDHLAYVRIGVGLAGEGFYLTYNQSGFDRAKARLVAWGYSPLAWKNWQEAMLTAFQKAFSYSTVIYPIVKLDTDPTTGEPVQMEVAYWAAAHGMGVGAQGLVPNYPSNYADIKTIVAYILSHYPQTYIQFQTVVGIPGPRVIQRDIQTASQLGARSIEWYEDDATNPDYQSLFMGWQHMVSQKFT